MTRYPDARLPDRRTFVRRLAGGLVALGAGGMTGACSRFAAIAPPARRPDALLLLLSDTHAAHHRYARILSVLDATLAAHPGVPAAVIFNGDVFERANPVALRGEGELDLEFVAALAARAPVVFNLGNHEASVLTMSAAVRALEDAGAAVVSSISGAGGRPLAPTRRTVDVGGVRLDVAGIATDDMATYRAEQRDRLSVPDPARHAAASLGGLGSGVDGAVVLSHAGLPADRAVIAAAPAGALLLGGHDHLRFQHRTDGGRYLHVGHWADAIGVVEVHAGTAAAEWPVRMSMIDGVPTEDAAMARRVARAADRFLEPEDREVVGFTDRALGFREAALHAVAAVRDAAGADVAVIGNTTFGDGLPSGPVPRHRFHAFLRFDNPLVVATVAGTRMNSILSAANQFDDVPFERRTGEYLVATPVDSARRTRSYRLVADGWIRMNAERYLGFRPDFEVLEGQSLREVVAASLSGPGRSSVPTPPTGARAGA
jgi:5'-nucleotidase / UDP-sugar diphosphatase